ncbi:MAG: hypothetical protein P4L61_04205 [Candidatus Pacebacteria bacterium]|nr:hypothetical protein [Candidatus Paceibacterota bacterium]
MNQNLQNLIITSSSMPDGLETRIMICVGKAAKRRVYEKVAIGSAFSIVFAVALVFVGRLMMDETAVSGFGQYFSLVFSNGGMLVTNWRDFAWTMVESAPVTGLALCLGAGGLFIATVRWTGKTFTAFNGANALRTDGHAEFAI